MLSLLVTVVTILSIILCSIVILAAGEVIQVIVGGEDTTIEDVPYQVSIRLYDDHHCGGSILNEITVLTAAHCFVDTELNMLSVLYGSTEVNSTKDTIAASHIVTHPNYDNPTENFDVALLILESPISFSDVAQPIALATEDPEPGSLAVITGWGILSEDGPFPTILKKIEVNIVSRSECKKKYILDTITEAMLCAGSTENKGVCMGDSGSPLVVNGVQVGIASWTRGCARPEYPGVYTNLAEVHSWIKENMPTGNSTTDIPNLFETVTPAVDFVTLNRI